MPRKGDGIERRKRGGKTVFVARPCKEGKRFAARTFDSYTEAKRYKQDKEGVNVTVTETCDAFAGRWLDDFPLVMLGHRAGKPKLESTLKRQRSDSRRFASEFEGMDLHMLLETAGRTKLRRFVLAYPHAARTVATLLSCARRDGLLKADPMDGIPIPVSEGRKNKRVITEEQVRHLADAALKPAARLGEYGHEFRAAILFSAYVGPRLSSLRWLERDELDLENRTVYFREGKGERDYPAALLGDAVEAARSFAWRLDRKPVRSGGSPLVFASQQNCVLRGTTHFRPWDRVRTAANMPDFNWHELRHWCGHHFYVTLGFSDELAGAQLGHTSGEQIRDTYGHGQQDALQRLRSGIEARAEAVRFPTPVPQEKAESA